jgi:hypothetical protein
MDAIRIKPAFRDLIPPLHEDELNLLEAAILRDGCRDPLVLWNDILIDGHNRYSICTKHAKPFKTVKKQFASEDEVMIWIIDNQLGRRNLSDEQKSYLRGKRYREEQKGHGGNRKSDESSGHNVHLEKTAERLAAEHGVSEKTIRRDAQFSESVDRIATVALDIKREILAGESPLTKKQVNQIADSASLSGESVRNAVDVARKAVHVSQNTGMPEWYTPPIYLDAAREVLGTIDLDPASSEIAQARVQAESFFTAEENGLLHDWSGKVWMNPPYTAGLVDEFLEKLCQHYEANEVTEAIVLVNNATETRWFQGAAKTAAAICFPSSRIRFLDPEGNPGAPLQGQAFIYFGSDAQTFCDVFNEFGLCTEVVA